MISYSSLPLRLQRQNDSMQYIMEWKYCNVCKRHSQHMMWDTHTNRTARIPPALPPLQTMLGAHPKATYLLNVILYSRIDYAIIIGRNRTLSVPLMQYNQTGVLSASKPWTINPVGISIQDDTLVSKRFYTIMDLRHRSAYAIIVAKLQDSHLSRALILSHGDGDAGLLVETFGFAAASRKFLIVSWCCNVNL